MSSSQFLPFIGDIIVTGETTGQVNRLHWNGTAFIATAFTNGFPGQPEDGIFVTSDIINTPPTTAPEPVTAALVLPALLAVAGIARRRKRLAR